VNWARPNATVGVGLKPTTRRPFSPVTTAPPPVHHPHQTVATRSPLCLSPRVDHRGEVPLHSPFLHITSSHRSHSSTTAACSAITDTHQALPSPSKTGQKYPLVVLFVEHIFSTQADDPCSWATDFPSHRFFLDELTVD
jgi:hypothetical protein